MQIRPQALGGGHTGELGVVGRVQHHLITSFFHARPRHQLPVNHPVALHASQQARPACSAAAALPSILPTLQNQPARAEATTQSNSTAAHLLASPPQSEQWSANTPASRPTGEETSSKTEPDVQAQTGEDGRQGVRDLLPRVVHRPLGHWIVTGSRRSPPADLCRHVHMPQGHLLEDNPRQALVPPPEPPDSNDHDLPAASIDVDSHQHGGNCSGFQPRARLPGRGTGHPPEEEPTDRITKQENTVNGTSTYVIQPWE